MKRRDSSPTALEVEAIVKGVALFVGSLTLAALLKPLAPWTRKAGTADPDAPPTMSEKDSSAGD